MSFLVTGDSTTKELQKREQAGQKDQLSKYQARTSFEVR